MSWLYCEDIKRLKGYGVCCCCCHECLYADEETEFETCIYKGQKAYVCCTLAKILINDKTAKDEVRK